MVQFVAQQQGSYTSYFTSVVSLSSTRADKLYYSTTRTPVCVTRPPKMTLPRVGYNRGGGLVMMVDNEGDGGGRWHGPAGLQ